MNKFVTIILLAIISLCGFILTGNFISQDFINYAIISGTISGILTLFTLILLFKNRSESSRYRNFIKDTLRTYDAIMVESSELPSLKGKNIVKVNKLTDLIDAQIEIKKPIYYKQYQDYTVFILLDNEEVCVSIVKLNENVSCEYETELEQTIKRNKLKDIDKSILDDIDKTTIIKLDNMKSFKVSPIRKENKEDGLTTKKYYLRKKNIFCTLSDDTEKRIMVKDIVDVVKTKNKEDQLLQITITTEDAKYVLKNNVDVNLEEIGERLIQKLSKEKEGFQEKVEYLEN